MTGTETGNQPRRSGDGGAYAKQAGVTDHAK